VILYEKLQTEYGEDLKSVLTEKLYNKMAAKKSFYLHSIVHCGIDLDKVGYTYEDYLEDFKKHADKFSEKKTVFNVLKSGHSPTNFYTTLFYEHLKYGFNYNSLIIMPVNRKKLLEVIDIDCDLGSYGLRSETYKRHIEVYGKKDDLEAFKKDFKLKRPILWEKIKEEWHLAFDGLLCEYIKYKSRD
jgi:hypothetical protein